MTKIQSVNSYNNPIHNKSSLDMNYNQKITLSSVAMQGKRANNNQPSTLKRVSLVTGFISLASMITCSLRTKNKWLMKHHKQIASLSLISALAHVTTAFINHKTKSSKNIV